MLGYGGNNSGNPSFVGGGTIKSQPTLYIIENYYEVKYDYGDAAKDDLSFPATASTAYADRIYIDKEDHTYQMPRPILKGCLFNGWDNRDDWQWGWLASHGYTSTQEDTRLGSVSRLTEDAYTHTMNFVTMLHKIEESTFSALRDVTLSAKFIEAGVGGSPSCLTVGFDPKGGTINGQKHLICETCALDGYDFALDIGKFKPVRDGYTFKGWCTDPKDEAGTLIKDTKPDSASAWAQDAHTELYAVWQSNTPTTISLAKAKVAAIKARTYTGKAIKPAVTVTLSGKTLKNGTDYTVAYRDNTNVGTATVTITGKGDYTGTVTASFRINPASLAKAKVAAIQARTYTGKAIKPTVKVTLSGKTLKKGADYTVAYKNNKAIGKASVTVKGEGNYTGSVSKTFAINPKAVSLASLTAGKGKLTVKWKKGTGGAGYQLQYGLKKNFKSAITVKITKTATVSRVLKKLKSGKTYYVRIRSYKQVGGKAYVSAWSKALSKKVK